MGLETASYLADLNASNPVGAADPRSQGDDHIRLMKAVLQATFPGLGGRIGRVQVKSGTYSLVAGDNTTLLNCAGAPWTLGATAAASLGNGFYVFVYNADASNTLTFDPNSSETVNGAATLSIPAGCSAALFCNGSSWIGVVMPSPSYVDAANNAALAAVGVARGIQCPYSSLKIDYATAATVTVNATNLVLKTAAGAVKSFPSISALTVNVGVSGEAGLDTGTKLANTWYHIWAIGDSAGNVSAVFSASSSAPTLPGSYTYYGYLGAIRTDGSGNFNEMYQVNHLVATHSTLSDNQLVIGGTSTSMSLLSNTVKAVPPTAVAAIGYMGSQDTGAGCAIRVGPTSNSNIGIAYTQGADIVYANFRVVMKTPQTLYYQVGSGDAGNVYVAGFEF